MLRLVGPLKHAHSIDLHRRRLLPVVEIVLKAMQVILSYLYCDKIIFSNFDTAAALSYSKVLLRLVLLLDDIVELSRSHLWLIIGQISVVLAGEWLVAAEGVHSGILEQVVADDNLS